MSEPSSLESPSGARETSHERAECVRSLIEALRDAQQAIVAGDLARLERCTHSHQLLCERLRNLNADFPSSPGLRSDSDGGELRQAVLLYLSLLTRARRSVQAAINTIRFLSDQQESAMPALGNRPAPLAR